MPTGYVERDGVRVFYEVYGEGEPTVLLLPTWSIIHSRHWKMQIPYLARHCRVVTFDGRGNGRSDRPPEPEAYGERGVRRRRAGGDGRDRDRARRAGRRSRGARSGRCCSPPTTPSGSRARCSSRRLCRSATGLPRAAAMQFDERARHRRGLGEVQPPLLAARLSRLPRVLLLADASPSRTRRSRSRTASAGGSRRRRDADRDAAARRLQDADDVRELAGPHPLPGARDPRERRRDRALAPRVAARGATGGELVAARRARATARMRATRSRSTCCCATS